MKHPAITLLAVTACLVSATNAQAVRDYTIKLEPIIAPELVRPPSISKRDFEGTWSNSGTPHFLIADNPPFTDAARKIRDHRMSMQEKGSLVASPHVLCRPAGVISTFTSIFPARLVQTDTKLKFFFEEVRGVRTIRIGGQHPKPLKPTYYGDSVAHWQGDTLVVDTTGFNGRIWLDNFAAPTSDQLHVIERISKSEDGAKLYFKITIDDPGTFTQSFDIEREWIWSAGVRQLPADCEENPSDDQVEGIVYEDEYLKPVCRITEADNPDSIVCKRD